MNLNVGAYSVSNQKSNHPSFKAIYIKEARMPWTKLGSELKDVKGMLFNQIPSNVAEKELASEKDFVLLNATGGIRADLKTAFSRYLENAKIFLTKSEASAYRSQIANGSDAKQAFEFAVGDVIKPSEELAVKQESLLPARLVA